MVTLFTNANVLTMTSPEERASEVAVVSGRIAAVGRSVPRELAERARKVDLKGATLAPAFIDSHVHWLATGLWLIGLRLDGAADHGDLAELIAAARRERGRGAWIIGMGAADNSMPEERLPRREEIDAWVQDSPVMIMRADGHGCAVNSAALRALKLPEAIRGLDAADGWLTGEAHSEAVRRSHAAFGRSNLISALRAASRHAFSKGVATAVCFEGFGAPADIDVLAVMAAGLLNRPRLRVFIQTRDPSRAARLRLRRVGGCFDVALDGSFSSHTAAMIEPFSDRPETSGLLYRSDEDVYVFAREAHLAGMQVAMHAIGDRAIEQALTAYERVIAGQPRADHRLRIEHSEVPAEGQIERIAGLGLHVAVQPAFLDMPTTPTAYLREVLGEKRFKRYMPLRSFLRAGVDISGGSDAPVSPIDPLRGVHMAVNHPNPDEALTPFEALRTFTAGGARSIFEERCRGCIEPGLDADLVVLSDDPLTIQRDRIEKIRIKATYIAGKMVYFKNDG